MQIYIYIYTCAPHVYKKMYMCTNMHVSFQTCTYIYTYACGDIYIYVYLYIYMDGYREICVFGES